MSDTTIDSLYDSHIALYPDFPQDGVLFRDITPLLRDPVAFRQVMDHWCSKIPSDIDLIIGTEARGFVFGAPMAYALGIGFVPVRKAGKLPGDPRSLTYDLEYGTATVEIAEHAIGDGHRVMVVDDLLATGGTARATVDLARQYGADVAGASFLIELEGLGGRNVLDDVPVTTVWSVPN
ncbi:adenine phosphoribosyltransferase [Helcobacillus sp. ACRRO]|uniref:adenine phosphoribosyltransferase n=1 Tax=Helcobacillus sp. ACRRO TaxID=2918202 RepID=UPI001EF42EC9|nr:adenine phosphoribosyltransferase [Helcobacillus sp. ACRRO]MCG7426622.1 adenine phosphoribosyltransferase [Helcobacillus sp. ACRRO]